MQVLVVGARGRTGAPLVEQLVAAGHQVRAMSRSISASDVPAGVEVCAADVLDPEAVQTAVQGVDAVVVCLSMVRRSDNPWAPILTPLDLHVRAAETLLGACEAAGVQRYVTVSAHGVGDSRARAGWAFLALVHSSNIGVAYNNLAEAEERVAASSLDWTVVRPTRLTLSEGTGRTHAAVDLVTTSLDRIPRVDLAQFLVRALEQDLHVKQRISVTGA